LIPKPTQISETNFPIPSIGGERKVVSSALKDNKIEAYTNFLTVWSSNYQFEDEHKLIVGSAFHPPPQAESRNRG